MIVEINEFSVSDEMLWVTGQTGRRQVDCSRVADRHQQTNDRRHCNKSCLMLRWMHVVSHALPLFEAVLFCVIALVTHPSIVPPTTPMLPLLSHSTSFQPCETLSYHRPPPWLLAELLQTPAVYFSPLLMRHARGHVFLWKRCSVIETAST